MATLLYGEVLFWQNNAEKCSHLGGFRHLANNGILLNQFSTSLVNFLIPTRPLDQNQNVVTALISLTSLASWAMVWPMKRSPSWLTSCTLTTRGNTLSRPPPTRWSLWWKSSSGRGWCSCYKSFGLLPLKLQTDRLEFVPFQRDRRPVS